MLSSIDSKVDRRVFCIYSYRCISLRCKPSLWRIGSPICSIGQVCSPDWGRLCHQVDTCTPRCGSEESSPPLGRKRWRGSRDRRICDRSRRRKDRSRYGNCIPNGRTPTGGGEKVQRIETKINIYSNFKEEILLRRQGSPLDCRWSGRDICKMVRGRGRNNRRFFRKRTTRRRDSCTCCRCKRQNWGSRSR